MSASVADVIRMARSLIGTPYHHQARQPGVGIDCIGVVICISDALGLGVVDHRGYGREPLNGLFERLADERLLRATGPAPGVIALMRWSLEPQHCAVLTDTGTMIHASGPQKPNRCVENRFGGLWPSRVVGWYAFPAVDYPPGVLAPPCEPAAESISPLVSPAKLPMPEWRASGAGERGEDDDCRPCRKRRHAVAP